MQIVFLQRFQADINMVMADLFALSPERYREVVSTTVPGDVLEMARKGGPLFVISGQVFNGKQYRGDQLANEVKKLNPEATFLMYSRFPEVSPGVDGFIEKYPNYDPDRYTVVARILAMDMTDLTLEKIHEAFPNHVRINSRG